MTKKRTYAIHWRRNPHGDGVAHLLFGPSHPNMVVCGLIDADRLEDTVVRPIERPCMDCLWSLETSHLRVTGQLA